MQTCLVRADKKQLGKHQGVAQALEEKERTGLFRLQEQVLSRKSFSLIAYGSWMNFLVELFVVLFAELPAGLFKRLTRHLSSSLFNVIVYLS